MSNTTTTKERNVKRLSKDFESIKRDLIEHIRVYFPDTYADFNESSIGVMLIELLALTGDSLHFYLDKQFQETFIESAKQTKNILKPVHQGGEALDQQ